MATSTTTTKNEYDLTNMQSAKPAMSAQPKLQAPVARTPIAIPPIYNSSGMMAVRAGMPLSSLNPAMLYALYRGAARTARNQSLAGLAAAENRYGQSIADAQASYLNTLRSNNAAAAAIQSGAVRGTLAANELSSLLGLQQESVVGATELAQQEQEAYNVYGQALAQGLIEAEQNAYDRRQQLAELSAALYDIDSQRLAQQYTAQANLYGTQYNADSERMATAYAADSNLAGTKYTADSNLYASELAARLSNPSRTSGSSYVPNAAEESKSLAARGSKSLTAAESVKQMEIEGNAVLAMLTYGKIGKKEAYDKLISLGFGADYAAKQTGFTPVRPTQYKHVITPKNTYDGTTRVGSTPPVWYKPFG